MRATRRGPNSFQLAIIFVVCSIFNILPLFSAAATTYFVRQEAIAGGDGRSWLNAFNKIQEAIDAATSGDQIWIKTGVFNPTDTITVTDAISIYGGFAGTESTTTQRDVAANPTTIHGFADKQTMLLLHPTGIILDGLTFSGSNYSMGALEIDTSSNPLITNCRFLDNAIGIGIVYGTVQDCYFSDNERSIQILWDGVRDGAITARIEGCTFENNLNTRAGAAGWGGGIYLGAFTGAEIFNCVFKGNSAGAGSGIAAFSQATALVNDCVFGGETIAEGNSSTAVGGGAIFGYDNAVLEVSNCSFQNNWTEMGIDGGAIYSQDGNLTITNSSFISNNSPARGGAVAIRRNTGAKNSSITGSTFHSNTAGALGGAVFSEIDLTTIADSLFTNNSAGIGGGFAGSGLVENTLFNGNIASSGHGGGAFIAREAIPSDLVHCVFYNNVAGTFGGAVSSTYNFSAINVIFYNNSAGTDYADIYNFNGDTPFISNSRITQSPYAESNNCIIEPPKFIDTVINNFRLLQTSPCIDTGLLAPATGLPPIDPDGNFRPMDGDYNGVALPDIGMYELRPPGDVDLNGFLELADVIRALQVVAGTPGLSITPTADINADNKIGLDEAIYGIGILVETSDHSVPPVGPDIGGNNWVGTLDLQNYGYQGHEHVAAVITQVGNAITITTNSSMVYAKKFKGTITSKGYISVIDKATYKTWTTHMGKATGKAIQLYDYVNNFTAFDTLFLVRDNSE